MGIDFKEVAQYRTNRLKYESNYDAIFNKQTRWQRLIAFIRRLFNC